MRGADGRPHRRGGPAAATCSPRCWRVQVGRVPLFLLDANVPETAEADRSASPAPLRHRERAHPPGAPAGDRRRARPGGPGLSAPGLPHERGALRLPGPGAHPALMETEGLTFYEAREAAGRERLHHPHPRAGRDRPLRPGRDRPLLRGVVRAARHRPGRVPGPRPAQPAMATSGSAWPCWPSTCATSPTASPSCTGPSPAACGPACGPAAGGGGAHRRRDQRRPPPCLISGDMPGFYERYLGPRWVDAPSDRGASGPGPTTSPARSCGAPTSGAGSAW